MFKKTFYTLLIGLFSASFVLAQPNTKYNAEVDALLKQMTLEEKIGQMTQLTFGIFSDNSQPKFNIRKDDLRKAIVQFNVGSILNNAQDHAQTLEEWHQMINTIQDYATKETRLKIPVLYGVDAIHGATYITNSTLFPQQIGVGCSRNTLYASEMGRLTAMSTRATGVRWNFAPVLEVGRSPLWSRFPETFGESTQLAQEMGVANITGTQGKSVADITAVAACMKHFIGYSGTNSGKDRTNAYIPETILRDVYLPPFRSAVNAGAKTVMINSGDINGIPVHANKKILTDLLRKELGFEGLAVTDWEDITKLVNRHRVAVNQKEAVYLVLEAGIDMAMVPYDYSFYGLALQLVKEGRISEARIDESVRRILKLKYELGLFANPYPEKAAIPNLYPKETDQAALNAARESLVLLKNNDATLPLKKGAKVFVTGPTANYMPSLSGSWSYTWQGTNTAFYPKGAQTILQAIQAKNGAANVTYKEGVDIKGEVKSTDQELLVEASKADYIIVCLGEDAYAEIPGNIDDLNLAPSQKRLAAVFEKAGKPVIYVLAEGRPRIITDIEPIAKSVLLAPQPGTQGGTAIAEVLFGEVNPSGKLAFTYHKAPNDLLTYDANYSDIVPENGNLSANQVGIQYRPLYPFGHGLSYTTFAYSNLTVSKTQLVGEADALTISVTVTNTGKLEGKEATDLFVTDLVASVNPAYRKHKGFVKNTLKPGESKTITFTLKVSDLTMTNAQNITLTEPGDFLIHIAGLEKTINYKK